jgi:hypothetical protein
VSGRLILGVGAAGLAGYGIYELFRVDVDYCSPVVLTGERNTGDADCPVALGLNICDPNDIAVWARRLSTQKKVVNEALSDVVDFVELDRRAAYDTWLASDPLEEQGEGISVESVLGSVDIQGLDLGALGYGGVAESIIQSVRLGCGYLQEINRVRRARGMAERHIVGRDKSDARRLRAGLALVGAVTLLYLGRRY